MTQAEKEAVLSLRQQQYSFSAIAETTGLPLGTIKSFLSRVGEKKESPVQASAPRVTLNHTCCRQCGAADMRSVRAHVLHLSRAILLSRLLWAGPFPEGWCAPWIGISSATVPRLPRPTG